MTVQNPHDRFFRDSFGRPEIARNYLKEYLPSDLLPLLDLDDLTVQEGSFIDEELLEHQSDLLYRTRLRDSERPLYLYFLFEHKSFIDTLVALQLLRYMLRFWEEQVKQKRPLSPIMPLVIYHGERVWSVPTDFFSLLDAPEALRPYLLDFQYQLNDFSHLSDEEIRGEIWLKVCLSVLRAVHHPGLRHELSALIGLIFQLFEQETGIDYIRTILYYFTKGTERVSRHMLEEAVAAQGSQGEKVMTTIAQEYIKLGLEQGRQIGLEQGLEQGLEKGRIEARRSIARQLLKLHNIMRVSEITGLSMDEVKGLAEAEANEEPKENGRE